MFSKIGVFIDSFFKGIGGWWVTTYTKIEPFKESPAKVLFIIGTWLTVCFAPIGLYWVHKFVFNVWVATFTSATPFADFKEERLFRKTQAYARKHDAEQCITKWKLKLNQ